MNAVENATTTISGLQLRPCRHQVAGHLFEDGKAGSLVDDAGHFYKPLQHGPRGDRELRFYELVKAAAAECTQDLAAVLRDVGPVAAPERTTDAKPRRHSLTEELPPRTPARSVSAGGARPRAESGLLRGNATVTSRDAIEAWPRSPSKGTAPIEQQGASATNGLWFGSPKGTAGPLSASSWTRTESWRPEKDDMFSRRLPVLATTQSAKPAVGAVQQQPEDRGGGSASSRAGGAVSSASSMASSPFGQAAQQQAAGSDAFAGSAAAANDGPSDGTAAPSRPADSCAPQVPEQVVAVASDAVGGISAQPGRAQGPEGGATPLLPGQLAAQLNAVVMQPGCGAACGPAPEATAAQAGSADGSGQPAAALASANDTAADLGALSSPVADRPARPAAGSDERGPGDGSGHLAPRNGYTLPYQPEAAFVLRNAPMLRAIPRFYGTVQSEECLLLELEDVAQSYKRPSIIDIKVGFKTWYPGSEERYIAKCKAKDAATTQSKLGFKICGMQVFRHLQRGFWRASKRWCKGMSEDAVSKALLRFANNEAGLMPKDIYGGPRGAIAQLSGLAAWFSQQREFCFYSSSVLIIYEGAATTADAAAVSIRLVDFAHTFPSGGQPDENFTAGVHALLQALTAVLSMDSQDCLM